jgi:hypothetical protein
VRYWVISRSPSLKNRSLDRYLEEPAGYARLVLRLYPAAPGQLEDR